jgi:hypothetical protein
MTGADTCVPPGQVRTQFISWAFSAAVMAAAVNDAVYWRGGGLVRLLIM